MNERQRRLAEVAVTASREDIEWLAAEIAALFTASAAATQAQQRSQQQYLVTVLPLEAIEQVDLEAASSSVAGIYDPLGQLRDFIEAALRQIAEWIVQAIEDIFRPVFDAIQNALGGIAGFFDQIYRALTGLGDLFRQVVLEPIQNMVSWVAENLPKIASSLVDAVNKALSFMAELGGMVASVLQGALGQVISWLRGLVDGIVSALSRVAEFLANLPSAILDALRSAIEGLTGFISSIVETIRKSIGWIVEQVSQLPARLSEFFTWLSEQITNAVSALAGAVAEAASRFTSLVAEAVQGIVARLSNILGGIVSGVQELLSRIGSALAQLPQMISQAASTVVSTISSMLDNMVSAIRSGLEWVRSAVAGLAETLSRTVSGALEAIRSAFNWVLERIRTVGQQLASIVSTLVSRLTSTIGNVVNALMNALSRLGAIVQDIVARISAAVGQVAEIVGGVVSEIVNRLTAAISGVLDWVRNGLTGIQELFANLAKIADTIVKALGDFIKLVQDFIRDPIGTMRRIIENAQKWVWEHLPDWARKFLEEAPKVLTGIADALMGFVNALLKFPEWFPKWFENHIVKPLLEGAEKYVIKPFYDTVVKPVQDWINEHIVKPIRDFFDWVGKGLESLTKALDTIRKGLEEFIRDPLGWIQRHILKPLYDTVVKPVQDWLYENIAKPLQDFFDAARSFFTDLPKTLESIAKSIQEFMRDPLGWIRKNVLEPLYENVFKPAFDYLYENVFKPVADWLYENVVKPAKEWIDEHIVKPVLDLFGAIVDAMKALGKFVGDVLMKLGSELSAFAENPIEWLRSRLWKPLYDNVFKPALDWVSQNIVEPLKNWLMEHIGKPVSEALSGIGTALETVSDFFTTVGEELKRFIENPIEWLKTRVVEPLYKLVAEPLKPVIDAAKWLAGWLNTLFERAGEALQQIGQAIISEAQAFIQDPIGWLRDKLTQLIDAAGKIVQVIVEKAGELGALVFGAISWLGRGASSIAKAVAEFMRGVFLEILVHLFTFLAWIGETWDKLVAKLGGVKAALSKFKNVVAPFTRPTLFFVSTFAVPLIDAMFKAMEGYYENPVQMIIDIATLAAFGFVASMAVDRALTFFAKVFESVEVDGILAKMKLSISKLFEALSRMFTQVFPEVLRYILIGFLIWWAEPTRVVTRYRLTEHITVELPPIETTVNALRRRLLSPERDEYYDMFNRQLRMGGIYRGFIEKLWPLPSSVLEDIAKRYKEVFARYSGGLDSMVVRDRWGYPRVFPASLVFTIPTPSELARMMVRDIIQDPVDFAAVMSMHGFHPDAALMFYLLHFRYPSPEKLADFFWRGVAGELWNPDKSYDKRMVDVFFGGRAPEVAAPRDLNFQGGKLFEMIKQYMKWHDYIRVPWQSGWPTDNAIVVELMADVPGKIDLRWMTRWGLFDYWGAYGFGATNTIEEITKLLVVEGQVTSGTPLYEKFLRELRSGKIVFDVRQFARALQATGMHPYWVPWVTIAETINALTEERTLLRTGFINLFREGLWDLDTLNKLMAGFFMVTFKTAFYDFAEHRWKEAEVEVPVAFLPAESKLLQLRAVMDKALDIYREAYRYMIRNALYYVVSKEEAIVILQDIVEAINKSFFTKEIEAITGKRLLLRLDAGYWDAWMRYVELLQDVEARERTRFYARYLIWSVLWGLRWGYTTREEAEEWVDKLVEVMHEHSRVRNAILLSVEFMLNRFYKEMGVRRVINLLRSRRITLEEAIAELKKLGFSEEDARLYIDAQVIWYTPSISTYASMLEVVPEAMDDIVRVVARFSLPRDEERYWKLYLVRQPIRDELTLLRTRIYNALSLGMSWDELAELLADYSVAVRFEGDKVVFELGKLATKAIGFYEANKQLFEAYGIAPHEWVLYNLIAELEKRIDELRRQTRERIPSPSTLAVLAEYIVLPEDLVEKTLRRYGVAEEWIPYWLQYIRVKPLKSDYKSLLSVYIRALRYGAVTSDEVRKFIDTLADKGFTPEEVAIIRKRVELEEAIMEARELRRQYLPTPYMLATLSEYVTVPENLVRRVLEARRVPEEWVELWLRFIRVRPLADEARMLATVFFRAKRYGVPLGDLEKKVLEKLRELGFTEEELELRRLRATIEALIDQWREAQREYIPTPMMLATIAEYVPAARAMLATVLAERRVPPEWWRIWQTYVTVRPLADEVRRLVSNILRLYENFVVTEDDARKALLRLKNLGYEEREIQLLLEASKLAAQLRAYREIVGDPDRLIRLAEYSPRARHLALTIAYRMIDALPVDSATKDFLKKMWEEFVRVRPVYDEVRRYVTELINDYAEGVITFDELRRELEELKGWGLDEYEIRFFLWLAEKRRARYMARQAYQTYY